MPQITISCSEGGRGPHVWYARCWVESRAPAPLVRPVLPRAILTPVHTAQRRQCGCPYACIPPSWAGRPPAVWGHLLVSGRREALTGPSLVRGPGRGLLSQASWGSSLLPTPTIPHCAPMLDLLAGVLNTSPAGLGWGKENFVRVSTVQGLLRTQQPAVADPTRHPCGSWVPQLGPSRPHSHGLLVVM